MKTEDLLRYTYILNGDDRLPFSNYEIKDRRRLLRRIIAGSRFSNYTDDQLDNLTAYQLPSGKYVITDPEGYEWEIDGYKKLDRGDTFG